jgi:hypothetical protein
MEETTQDLIKIWYAVALGVIIFISYIYAYHQAKDNEKIL